MLMIDTYTALSGIQGTGLFAKDYISTGTVVWHYHKNTCQSFYKKIFLNYCYNLAIEELKQVLHHSYVLNGIVYKVTDNTKFINHSLDPNIAFLDDKTVIAVRDINPGEEILENYMSSYDPNDFFYLDFETEPNKEILLHHLKKHLLKYNFGENQLKAIS